ncbi:MAG: two-component system response regulator [Desulfobacterales bacterium]|nr:MAG: two-component system response regulator [Desulfobacterales bacterium]
MALKKILIADDSPTEMNFMKAPFMEAGYQVATASDGQEALTLAGQQEFDLVVLDVVMPKLNGFQACRKIKDLKPKLPIILLTSKNQKSDEFWGKKQGADVYMTKPFDADALMENANRLMA